MQELWNTWWAVPNRWHVSDVNTSNIHFVKCSFIVFVCCFVWTSCTNKGGGSPSFVTVIKLSPLLCDSCAVAPVRNWNVKTQKVNFNRIMSTGLLTVYQLLRGQICIRMMNYPKCYFPCLFCYSLTVTTISSSYTCTVCSVNWHIFPHTCHHISLLNSTSLHSSQFTVQDILHILSVTVLQAIIDNYCYVTQLITVGCIILIQQTSNTMKNTTHLFIAFYLYLSVYLSLFFSFCLSFLQYTHKHTVQK